MYAPVIWVARPALENVSQDVSAHAAKIASYEFPNVVEVQC